jgi:hypothetical protein
MSEDLSLNSALSRIIGLFVEVERGLLVMIKNGIYLSALDKSLFITMKQTKQTPWP